MEVRERGHSPPFWASSSNASTSNPSPSSPYSSSNSTQSGIRPWVIVVVFSIVALLFLPYILSSPSSSSSSSKSGRFNLSIKSGWDVFNLCLVVFAILCGVLGRIGERSGPDSGSYKQPRNEWRGHMNQMGDVNRTAVIGRSRSSGSYPDPRLETDMWGQNQNRAPDGWRFFDNAELDRARRPVQFYGVLGSSEEERECKTIPVHTQRFPQMVPVANQIERFPQMLPVVNQIERFPQMVPVANQIERFPQMGQMENAINFEEGNMVSGAMYEEEKKVRKAMVVRRRMRSLEALPKWEEGENEPTMVVGRRRRRSLERFPSIKEAEKETKFQEEVEVQEEEEVENRQMEVRRGRKSMETFPVMNEIEEETKLEEEMVEKAPEAVVSRTNSCESVPEIEEIEKDTITNIEDNVVEKPPIVVEVTPPPPPPPPPPSEKMVVEECRKHKRSGSGGGAKDIASAIALLYQKKKKGNKSKRKEKQEVSIESNPNLNSVIESNTSTPSTAPPPPPPPPPASIFHQLFSNKKGGNKSRKIHSLAQSQSASTHSTSPSTVNIISTPPPPPPPPYQKPHRSSEDQIASSGYRRIEHTELYDRRRWERPNLSRFANYPLPPRSPLPPPPPSPPPVCENVSEIIAPEEQRSGNVAVHCPSPDVNDKADLFIRRFRDGLKLEKINSIREKEKRKEGRQERDGN